jgi:acyl-ACP thioesterase
MVDIWQEPIIVPFSTVDKTNRLTPSGAFDFFQEAANKHAEDLDVGLKQLEEAGPVWILSRMSVYMETRPRYRDKLTLRTWPRGSQKLFAIRDYDLQDENGQALVRGRSGWIIVDIEKKRPLRPDHIVARIPHNEGVDALPDGAGSVPPAEGAVKTAERRACYSDIDMNGHVNNARYIQWIQDALDPEIFYQADKIRLDINYTSEILLDETVELWTAPGSKAGALIIEGRKSDNPQPSFRAELWTGR